MVSDICRLCSAVVVAALAGLASMPALAGDREYDHRQNYRHSAQRTSTDCGLPSVPPGIGTYAGSVSAASFRGIGTYVTIDHTARRARTIVPAPKALIIEVDAETSDAACSYEAGVCMIKP